MNVKFTLRAVRQQYVGEPRGGVSVSFNLCFGWSYTAEKSPMTIVMELWQYRATVERVVDGDTLDLKIDLGFGVLLTGDEARVRLRDVDTAELFGVPKDSEEYAAGQRQKAFVQKWVAQAEDREWPFLIQTWKDDERGKYGRWLAVLKRRSDGAVLNEDLVDEFGEAVRP